jgi:hypothetical protein
MESLNKTALFRGTGGGCEFGTGITTFFKSLYFQRHCMTQVSNGGGENNICLETHKIGAQVVMSN